MKRTGKDCSTPRFVSPPLWFCGIAQILSVSCAVPSHVFKNGNEDRQDSNPGSRQLGNSFGLVVGERRATNFSLGQQCRKDRADSKNTREQRLHARTQAARVGSRHVRTA